MRGEGFNLNLRGLDGAKQTIDNISRNYRGVTTEAVSYYIVQKLRFYPPYKYVSRREAYGTPFFSDAQRRYVMAAIAEGRIDPGYPHRTGELQRGWQTKGTGTLTRIVNDVPYAGYVMGNLSQSAHEYHVGWKKVKDIIVTYLPGALAYAREKVRQLIANKGKV